jgi:hypothetical protein
MPLWAIILDIWANDPVYHRFASARRGVDGTWRDYTSCGRVVGAYKPWLPMKHVVKFARPCKGCFGPRSTTGSSA